ncbi:Necrosis inducing protein [Phytophthora cactorum]|nr:Necrosis inducing protein [Phytophthora cactorum]
MGSDESTELLAIHVYTQVLQLQFGPRSGHETPTPTPEPTQDPGVWVEKQSGHNEVKSFLQPQQVTVSEKADVKGGCEPFHAVNEFGGTDGGLESAGKSRSKCGGSRYGFQVFGRSMVQRCLDHRVSAVLPEGLAVIWHGPPPRLGAPHWDH